MKFCDNIRNLRREKDFSQEYLAEKMGVTRQTISKWENGTAMPDLKKLIELADFFQVSMDDLLGLEYEKRSREELNDPAVEKEYVTQIYSSLYDNQQPKDKSIKGLKIMLTIVFVVLIISCIVQYNTFYSYSDRINQLQNQINFISSAKTTDDDFDNDYFSSYEVLSVDKDKPYLVTVKFTYAPKSYVKGTVVSFSVPSENNERTLVEAEEENGAFTAQVQIDVTLEGDCETIIDDGTTKTKELIDFLGSYIYIDIYSQIGDFTVQLNDENEYLAETVFTDVYFNTFNDIKIKNAYVTFGFDDKKPIYREDLTIKQDEFSKEYPYVCSVPQRITASAAEKDSSIEYAKLTVTLVDEKGVEYSTIVEKVSDFYGTSTADDTSWNERETINFGNGKVLAFDYTEHS